MKDLARIYVKAGDGGDGAVHFHHGKYQPKGGPDGGDGGDGGDVILVADENIQNLVEFNFKKKFIVPDGEHGWGKNMHGKNTDPIEIRLPVGTVVYEINEEESESNLRDRETLEQIMQSRRLMVDMTSHGQRFEVAWGGRGGRGNFQFRSATNQTPKEFEPGKPGDAKWLLLELKVIADFGIVGLPNVGKSSLLKSLTNANPKIAGYPFTTLEPNLGVVRGHDKNLILVDVPGVIEEAWEGKGIGPWFLRHLERVHTLLHVLAPSQERTIGEQMLSDYRTVRHELEKYGHGLPQKKELIIVNKSELISLEDRPKIEALFKKELNKEIIWVSAGMGEVHDLVEVLTR